MSILQYDAVAQRVDRNRTGFITFHEVFQTIWSLHPSVLAFHTFLHQEEGGTGSTALAMALPTYSSTQLHAQTEMVQSAWPLVVLFTMTMCSEYVLNTTEVAMHPLSVITASSDEDKPPPKKQLRSVSEQWLHILTSATHSKASAVKFARYLQEVQTQAQENRRSRAELLLLDEAQAQSKSNTTDRQIVHDQAFISGLLLETTKDAWDVVKLVHDHLSGTK